jgi:hypothetical protein
MMPLYLARIEDLERGDVVRAGCRDWAGFKPSVRHAVPAVGAALASGRAKLGPFSGSDGPAPCNRPESNLML